MDPVTDAIAAEEISIWTPELEAAVERAYQRLAEQGITHPERASWSEFSNLRRLIARGRTLVKRGTQAYSTYLIGKQLLKSFDSARKGARYTMKSWRKRAADFGQFERRVKRKVLRSLGKKYRTTSKKKKSSSNYGGYRQGGGMRAATSRFRRFRRVKKPMNMLKYVRERAGDVVGSECCWLGVNGSMGYDNLIHLVAASLSRAMLAKAGFQPNDFEDVIDMEQKQAGSSLQLVLRYRGLAPSTGDDALTTSVVSFGTGATSTFEAFVAAVRDSLKSKIASGWQPYEFMIWNPTTQVTFVPNTDLEDAKLKLSFTNVITIQNHTTAPGGSSDSHDIAAQTLKGKIYKFNHAAPRLRKEIHKTAEYDAFGDEVTDVPKEIAVGSSGDHHLRHPQAARAYFTNCAGVADVALPPGDAKKVVQKFTYSGKFINFMNKSILRSTSSVYPATHAIGSNYWFAFERVNRHGTTNVNIAYNVECHQSGHLQLVHKRPNLVKYDVGGD
jgi:hypothetical protein